MITRDTRIAHVIRVQIVLAGILAIGLLLAGAAPAIAHGAKIDYRIATTVSITALYDSGEPMAGAQVAIYAPDEPQTPWLTGVCDDQGRFSFTPDPAKPGTWDLQVRLAGHGDIIHIPVGAGSDAGGAGSLTPAQIVLMAGCVIWGFVGTALFFSKRRAA